MNGIINRERAAALHRESLVLDAHCDTLTAMPGQNRRLGEWSGLGQLDLPRLKAGGVKVQFFAAFIAPEFKKTALKRALELIDLFYSEMEANPKDAVPVRSPLEIEQAVASGRIAALLSIEGGEALQGSMGVLRMLHRLGVRSLTLTWNGSNELGHGVGPGGEGAGGLTAFGAEVVKEMNRLGMLVDVSHLSEQGFWDVIRISGQPVIASHSNCRALCEHPRNLSDEQIRALAAKGGVMGVTFVPAFLGGARPSVKAVLDHIGHAVAVGGVECVGLGSDFDGTGELPAGLADCTKMPFLTEGLLERGYGDAEIKKILGENFLRVIGQVLK
ncbi:MAG: dipeptidase [Peptococcaceae bacterium]|nr:dipeptidase [Peptococcaceae bacterium]